MEPATVERVMRYISGRLAALLAVALTIGLAGYIVFNAWTLAPVDRNVLGIGLDARWVCTPAGIIGLVYVTRFREDWAQTLWGAALTVATAGRALDLIMNGSSVVLSRTAELKGAYVWFLLWGFGILGVLVLSAYAMLWGRQAPLRGS